MQSIYFLTSFCNSSALSRPFSLDSKFSSKQHLAFIYLSSHLLPFFKVLLAAQDLAPPSQPSPFPLCLFHLLKPVPRSLCCRFVLPSSPSTTSSYRPEISSTVPPLTSPLFLPPPGNSTFIHPHPTPLENLCCFSTVRANILPVSIAFIYQRIATKIVATPPQSIMM